MPGGICLTSGIYASWDWSITWFMKGQAIVWQLEAGHVGISETMVAETPACFRQHHPDVASLAVFTWAGVFTVFGSIPFQFHQFRVNDVAM